MQSALSQRLKDWISASAICSTAGTGIIAGAALQAGSLWLIHSWVMLVAVILIVIGAFIVLAVMIRGLLSRPA